MHARRQLSPLLMLALVAAAPATKPAPDPPGQVATARLNHERAVTRVQRVRAEAEKRLLRVPQYIDAARAVKEASSQLRTAREGGDPAEVDAATKAYAQAKARQLDVRTRLLNDDPQYANAKAAEAKSLAELTRQEQAERTPARTPELFFEQLPPDSQPDGKHGWDVFTNRKVQTWLNLNARGQDIHPAPILGSVQILPPQTNLWTVRVTLNDERIDVDKLPAVVTLDSGRHEGDSTDGGNVFVFTGDEDLARSARDWHKGDRLPIGMTIDSVTLISPEKDPKDPARFVFRVRDWRVEGPSQPPPPPPQARRKHSDDSLTPPSHPQPEQHETINQRRLRSAR